MDCGEDVKRRSRTEVSLANAISKNAVQLMAQWTEDNFFAYVETMDLIREHAPVQWAKLYQDAIKMGLAKETNININFNRQQDREGLQGLVRARLLPEHGDYVPYEEVKPKKLASIKKEGEH